MRALNSHNLLILVFLISSIVSVYAQDKPNLVKKTAEMQQLWRNGKLLEAMDTATVILSIDENNRTATDFVYRHWQKMQDNTEEKLRSLSDEDDLQQAVERCEIYRLLDEINANLRVVRMPLYGPNQRWVWQPETGYYSGHYDTERTRAYKLCVQRAKIALMDFNADEAGAWYETAINNFLITDRERNSNRKQISAQLNDLMNKLVEKNQSNDNELRVYYRRPAIARAIFAYDLSNLSLQINPDQKDIREQQPALMQQVAELYQQKAAQELTTGDTIRAKESEQAAQMWQQTN